MSLSLRLFQILCASALGFLPTFAADTDAWRSRSIYQTMTDRFARPDGSANRECNVTAGLYCGGTWRGTINHLDYIQGMGFDAVMISPVIENVEGRVSYGEAYHGYWQKDLYSLNAHFGTHQDLIDLSDELHKRDMFLMLDTVINNMAYILNGSAIDDIDYSIFDPFDSPDYFHPYCNIGNYSNYPLAQRCWTGDKIVPLPDLKTEDDRVQSMLGKWIKEMISTYSIDGLRVDAAKHVNESFLPTFHDAADSFMTGEVYEKSSDIICNYQQKYIESVPNYPIYFAILEAFTKGNPSALSHEIDIMRQSCPDVTALASFSENHDVSRIASMVDDITLAKTILAFTLLFDGIPIIYQGQEQHFTGSGTPLNRKPLWESSYNTQAPLYKLTSTLNRLRQHAAHLDPTYLSTTSYPLYTNSSELVVRKGQVGRDVVMVLSSQGSGQKKEYDLTLKVGYMPGVVAMDVLNCVNYTASEVEDHKGELVVDMKKGEPRVLYPVELLRGSGLCGYERENVTYKELVVDNAAAGMGGLGVKVKGLVGLVVGVGIGMVMLEW